MPPESVEEQWDVAGLETALASDFQMAVPVAGVAEGRSGARPTKRCARVSRSRRWTQYASKEAQVGPELMRQFERSLMLQTLDQHWRDHLANLDHLRQGIHLRGYAQKNPKQEYKRESFELFSDMLDRIKQDVVRIVLTVQVRTQADVAAVEEAPAVSNVKYQHADYDEALASAEARSSACGGAVRSCERKGRAQRSVPVRVGQEVQALSRAPGLTRGAVNHHYAK